MRRTAAFEKPQLAVHQESRALIINPEQAAQWSDSIHTVREVLAHTEDVFGLMEQLISDGDYSGHFGIPAVLAMSKRAVASVTADSERMLEVVAFLQTGN
jgi:hypothetical protein